MTGAAVLRIGVVPAERCPPTTPGQVISAVEAAVHWTASNQHPDGRFAYGYHRDEDRIDLRYSDARHSGLVMALYQAHRDLGSAEALAAADAGTAFALASTFEEGGWVAWDPGGSLPSGANALLLAGLTIRRQVTGDPRYDDTMRGLGGFLLAVQHPDGGISSWWHQASGAPSAERDVFSTGEASWALALLDQVFPGEGWGDAARRTLRYLAEDRVRAEGHVTRYPDHWAAYTIEALGSADEVADRYARRLAGYFGVRLRFDTQVRQDGVVLAARFLPGPPAGVGAAMEGMGALWRTGRLRDLDETMTERLRCVGGLMVRRQQNATDAARWPRPSLVEGAWFYRGYTQMDDQQHLISGLLALLDVFEEDR